MNIDIPENERLDTQNDALEEVYNSLLKWQFLVCILDFWSVKFFRGHFQLPWFRSLNQTGEIDRVTEFFRTFAWWRHRGGTWSFQLCHH